MKLANVGGRASLVLDGGVLDIEEASGGTFGSDPSAMSHLDNHPRLRELARAVDPARLPRLEPERLRAPVPVPGKIVALALNYRSHAVESNLTLPEEPHIFAKFP